MKRKIFLFAGIFILLNLIIGGALFLKYSGYLSSEEPYEMMHQSDYED
ncbi:MAG: hypothetical protein PHT92_11320 [Bacteroidales bacterium]|nr:hypothetical protein [Bacteroidales bacterium]